MLNYLKYELHKILRAKSFFIIVFLALILEIVLFISNYFISKNALDRSVIYILTSGSSFEGLLLLPLFAIWLVTKDFSSGYMKNIYRGLKYPLFVLSKFIIIFLFSTCYVCFCFILRCLFKVAFSDGVIWTNNDLELMQCSVFILFLHMNLFFTTAGFLGATLAFATKNNTLSYVIFLVWYLYVAQNLIYPILYETALLLKLNIERDILVFMNNYTIFGGTYLIQSQDVNENLIPLVANFYIKLAIYSTISYLTSWLTLKLRRV